MRQKIARKYKDLRKDILDDTDDPRHGSSYVVAFSYNCPCEKCVQLRKDAVKDMRINKDHPLHGTIRGYVYGKCRCAACTAAFQTKTYQYQRTMNWKRIGIVDFVWDDYIKLLSKQHNECAICGRPINGNGEVDHDHSNGRVRGIVCHECNHAVRSIEHSLSGKCLTPEMLVLTLQYIMKNEKRNK